MTYFDNAATSFPKPRCVIDTIYESVTKYGGNPGRSGHKMSLRTSEKLFSVREKVSQFFNSEIENVVFTNNCTHSLNIAIKGVLKDGDHAIISCLEHNSVLRPVHKLSTQGKNTYSVATVYPNDTQKTVESFKSLITSRTKAIITTHASNVTGDILPISEISALCKQHGLILIVDAAQTAGVLPIDVQSLGIDYLCVAAHKGLYGTTGSGLLIVNNENIIDSFMEGGTGSRSLDYLQPEEFPERFESGTPNVLGALSIGAGVDYVNYHKIQTIYQYEQSLCKFFITMLQDRPQIKLYQTTVENRVPIVCFNVEGADCNTVVEELSNSGFALRGGFHCSALAHEFLGTANVGVVRFSPGFTNTENQVDRLAKTLIKQKWS